MKTTLLLCGAFLLLSVAVHAAPVLVIGTPGNSQLSTPTLPSPLFGTRIDFDTLTPFSTFSPSTYASQGVVISSPDGLSPLPFSTQSFENELYDMSSDGTADITIQLDHGVGAIGIGIADSDPVSIILQALNADGSAFGDAFNIDLASTESLVNTGNGYYVLRDTSADIFGLRILQTSGNASLYSGLAIDDLQISPEPGTVLLLGAGLAAMGWLRLRGRA